MCMHYKGKTVLQNLMVHFTKHVPSYAIRLSCLLQGFWDAMIMLSQHRRDDVPMVGRPERTRSVSETLALLHAQRMQRRALEYEDR